MTDKEYLRGLRVPTQEVPLRILVSACLLGTLCGADGSSYGSYPHILSIRNYSNVKLIPFCPENFVFGTPREIPDIEGGTGEDVLDGKASVVTESGKDVTEEMLAASEKMLQIAVDQKVELAILMDISAACGSQVTYKGHRLSESPAYQKGTGVCTALLKRNGIRVISQRDYASLEVLFSKINPEHIVDESAIDHDQTDWYTSYFDVKV